MIPKIIHQVFWPFKGKELNDINVFRESTEETKRYCDQYKYKYHMWDLKQCEELLCEEYPQYIWLWTEFRYDIQRCDFIRYLILHKFGGFYVDCDVYPIQNLDSLLNHNEIFTTWPDDKNRRPYNAAFGSVKNNDLFIKISNDIENRVSIKQNMKIYDTWRGRLVFQTTGHNMLRKHIPKESIYDLMLIHNEKKNIFITANNPYFYDKNASIWFN